MCWRYHQGFWTAAAAILVALWVAVPGCRRVRSTPEKEASSGSDKALSTGTMRPSVMRPVVRPRPPARPSSGRAKIPTKKKVAFKLVRFGTEPNPVPGCPKCGTKVPGRGVIHGEGKLLGYRIRVYQNGAGLETFTLFKDGKRLHANNAFGHLFFGSTWGFNEATDAELKKAASKPKSKRTDEDEDPERLARIKAARDWLTPGGELTGNGRRYLVVQQYVPGRRCCTNLHLFELKPKFRKVQSIWLGYRGGWFDEHFRDLDKDGFPEIELQDWTFAFWKASFDISPAPRIVLKFQKGRYRIATSLMQRPPPSLRDLRNQAKSLQHPGAFSRSYAPHKGWATMLQLAYTGHAQLASKFFNMAWRKGAKGKRQFLAAFRKRLRESPYWPAVRKMDGPI